jgi:HNH endonuclease
VGKGAFNDRTKQIVRQRALMRCERCGLPLIAGAHFHHRKPRGMGGTSDSDLAGASNCLYVHPHCHASLESNRKVALKNGWLVRNQYHPMTIPIFRWGLWVILDDEGNALPVQLPTDEHMGEKK